MSTPPLSVLACLLGVTLAHASLAQSPVPPGPAMPAAPAAGGAPDKTFSAADRNSDGRLDASEFDAYSRGHGGVAIEPGQGIPATDQPARALRNFGHEDHDGDGYISTDELSQGR